MISLKPVTLLSVATLLIAAFFVGAAVPCGVPPTAAAADRGFALDVMAAEIQRCESAGGRDHHECVDEAQGKALIERAEWLSRLDRSQRVAGQGGAETDAAGPGATGSVRTSAQ